MGALKSWSLNKAKNSALWVLYQISQEITFFFENKLFWNLILIQILVKANLKKKKYVLVPDIFLT